jgi:hypothetical protein
MESAAGQVKPEEVGARVGRDLVDLDAVPAAAKAVRVILTDGCS